MTNLALFQMNLHCNFSFYAKIFHKTKYVILRVTSIYQRSGYLDISEVDIKISVKLIFKYLVKWIFQYLVKWIFKYLGDIQISAPIRYINIIKTKTVS